MDEESESAARDSGRLDRLESSALRAIRDAARSCRRPAMLFSAGKDSCVILHLARKRSSLPKALIRQFTEAVQQATPIEIDRHEPLR